MARALQAARRAWAVGAQKQARLAEEPSRLWPPGSFRPWPADRPAPPPHVLLPPAPPAPPPQAEHGKSDVRIPVLAKNVADLHLLGSHEAQGAGPGSPPGVPKHPGTIAPFPSLTPQCGPGPRLWGCRPGLSTTQCIPGWRCPSSRFTGVAGLAFVTGRVSGGGESKALHCPCVYPYVCAFMCYSCV